MLGDASRTSRPISALLLGLAATALVAAGHLADVDRWMELGSLDLRFRWLTTAPLSDDIVNVDIDDRSLEELGRWPWPREQLAGLVETLEKCGARTVALDIILPDPQKVRYAPPIGVTSTEDMALPPEPVFDDMILAETVQRYDNVYLPMHIVVGADSNTTLEREMEVLVLSRPEISLVEAAGAVALKGGRPDGNAAVDREALVRAYLRGRALAEMRRFSISLADVGECPTTTGAMVPPLVTFARAARHSGFVTFDPDGDGVVRRIPLLARKGMLVYPQFALSLAAGQLAQAGGQPCALSATADSVVLQCGPVRRVIPVDRQGYMLMNWMPSESASGVHVSAADVGRVWVLGKELEGQKELQRLYCMSLMDLSRARRTEELDNAYWELAHQQYPERARIQGLRTRAEMAQRDATLFDPARVPPAPEALAASQARVEGEIDSRHQMFLDELSDPNHLDVYLGRPPASAAATQPAMEQAFREREKEARDILSLLAALPETAQRDRQEMESQLARLREKVSGRICLIGSAATGAADFVPTPMNKRTPGVIVHTNILNTVLSGRFVRPAHWGVNLAAIVLAGLAVSLVTARRPVWVGGPLVVLLAGAYAAGASLVAFRLLNVWVAMVAPLSAMFFSLLVVTAYRQLTEERAKKKIRGLFANALSPALVDRLTEDPSLLRLGGERRVLSCFFSDLQGFTPLSKRLKEQGTVRLLNRYFDRMTEVVQNRHGGYLSKFMGDGIFVFFGAPVAFDDHAGRALQSALECQAQLTEFNEVLKAEWGTSEGLVSRIGVATGEVMVGNCGSTDKFDYTAIGPTVNLASRLEGANKSFGTRILVDEATWKGAFPAGPADADGVVARCMGKILVVGENEPAVVWNPLGRRGEVPAPIEKAAGDFTAAMGLFAARRFAEAAELLEACLKAAPGDAAAELFLDLCRKNIALPPGPDWDGVVQLTHK